MSDTPRGPDWWRASDGRYYPPEATPGPRAPSRPPQEPRPADPETDRPPASSTPPGVPLPGVPAVPAARPSPDDPVPTAPRADDAASVSGPSRRRRRRWPIVVILAILAAAAGAAVWVFVLEDDEPEAAPLTTETTDTAPDEQDAPDVTLDEPDAELEVSVFALGAADCFVADDIDDGAGGIVRTVEVVDCDEPHFAVIFGTEALGEPDDAPFPGTEERDEASKTLCEPGFEEYVGVPLSASELVLVWLAPTPESWEDGDRDVACAVAAPDGELLTASVAGSER